MALGLSPSTALRLLRSLAQDGLLGPRRQRAPRAIAADRMVNRTQGEGWFSRGASLASIELDGGIAR
jgi:hypothetical protein